MRSALLGLALVGAAGCLDFDKAKEGCEARGDCLRQGTAPSLVGSEPRNQATEVPTTTNVVLRFSKSMDKESVQLVPSPSFAFAPGVWSAFDGGADTEVTFRPTAPLAAATGYTVGVSGRSVDLAPLATGTQLSFTTTAAPDTTAPTLVSTSPANNADRVLVGFFVVLTFSEAMEPASVGLTFQPDYDEGEGTWSLDGRTVTYSAPPAMFQPLTQYLVSVDGRDLAGNPLTGLKAFNFVTNAVTDTTRPTVVASAPAAGATNVSVNVRPSVTFSEPMNAASVATSFLLQNRGDGGSPSCTVQPDPSGTTFTCIPSGLLQGSSSHSVSVGVTATDGAGNMLAGPFSFSFETGTTPDTTAPTVVTSSPRGPGQVRTPTVVVEFSEPMDKASAQAALKFDGAALDGGSFSWDDAGTTLSYRPVRVWNYGDPVNVRVDQTAKDLAQNSLADSPNRTWAFTVLREYTATLTADLAPSAFDDVSFDSVGVGYTSPQPPGAFGHSSQNNLVVGEAVLATGVRNRGVRAVLSFNLGAPALPAGAVSLTAATLTMRQTLVGSPYDRGTPFVFALSPASAPGFGGGSFQTLFDAAPVCLGSFAQCLSANYCIGVRLCPSSLVSDCSATVTNLATYGFNNGRRMRLRIDRRSTAAMVVGCPEVAPSPSAVVDALVKFNSADALANKPTLQVTYLAP